MIDEIGLGKWIGLGEWHDPLGANFSQANMLRI